MSEEKNIKKYKEKDIVDEIHDGRAALLDKYGGNLRALFDDARRRDEESKRTVVSREHSRGSGAGHRSEAS